MTIYEDFREKFIRSVKYIATDGACVAYSGGTDSTCLVFALVELGYHPELYTLQLGEYESEDVKASKSVARKLNLKQNIVKIPQEDSILVADILEVIKLTNNWNKARVQVNQCLLHLARQMHKDDYEQCFTGMYADTLWGTSREFAFINYREGTKGFTDARRKTMKVIDSKVNPLGYHEIFASQDMTMLDPYDNRELKDFALSLSYEQIFKPFSKALPIIAFKDYFHRIGFKRGTLSMQVGAGIRAWHDTLISSKYNTIHSKTLPPIYKHMYETATGEKLEYDIINVD